MTKVIVIGGGASGLVAAIYAKKAGNEVTILERNSTCGKKILATGNGHCNYWNENQSLTNYHSTSLDNISSIISEENIIEIQNFFKSLGIIPKIKNGYYYPSSNQATSIANALIKEAKINNINIITDTLVTDIINNDNKFIIKTNNNQFIADKLILATGGLASPKTGSDGLLMPLLKESHKIIKQLPALCAVHTNEKNQKELAGIRSDVKVSLYEDNKLIKEEVGEMQHTQYGLSGICIMQLSTYIAIGLDKNKNEEIVINYLPNIANTKEELYTWLINQNKILNNRSISDILDQLLNYKLVNYLLNKVNINSNDNINNIDHKELLLLCELLVTRRVNVINTNTFEESQVTSGGISFSDVDVNTLGSKKIKNMYFCGEILDIDGACGGYNLGFAWISGYIAGKSTKGE